MLPHYCGVYNHLHSDAYASFPAPSKKEGAGNQAQAGKVLKIEQSMAIQKE